MTHDKIALVLQDIAKMKDKLKDIRKDMKAEEKIEEQDYLELKKAYKDLRKQIKEKEEDHEEELKQDDFYNKLREMKVKTEEEIALANEKLFEMIEKLPQKFMEMDIEIENGRVKVQIQPEMRVYLNGREEKKRA